MSARQRVAVITGDRPVEDLVLDKVARLRDFVEPALLRSEYSIAALTWTCPPPIPLGF